MELDKSYLTPEKSKEIAIKMEYLENNFGDTYHIELGQRVQRKMMMMNVSDKDTGVALINEGNQAILDIYEEWVENKNK